MPRTQVLKLKDLLVNTENYRFEPLSGQREAIDQMVENQGDYLLSLAEDILHNGLNPNDRIQVVASHHDPSKYIVLEGNRRTVAMKLTHNPELLETAALKKRFAKLDKSKLPKSIECLVYSDPGEADHWIGLKHGYGKSGVMTDGWDPIQKQRFSEKVGGKTSISLQVLKALKDSPHVKAGLKGQLDGIKTTNLDRLIGDAYVRSKLGLEINNGVLQSSIAQEEIIKGLATIAENILSPGFKVAQIYNRDDRKDYVDSIVKSKLPDLTKKVSVSWQLSSNAATPSAKSKQRVQSPHRSKLIPKACKLEISNAKVNDIYHELMAIDVKNKNAVAVLFRVFVELSIDTYIEVHKITPAVSAQKSGWNLQQKVFRVIEHLEVKKKADDSICKGIRSAVKDAHDVLGIDTLHSYVHNNKFSPKPENLIITWNNIESFMSILWENAK